MRDRAEIPTVEAESLSVGYAEDGDLVIVVGTAEAPGGIKLSRDLARGLANAIADKLKGDA